MDVIERMYLIWRCECGAQAPWSGHRTICSACGSRTRTEVEVIPAEQHRAAVETLHEVRLLGKLWERSGDSAVRIMGADLVQILNGAPAMTERPISAVIEHKITDDTLTGHLTTLANEWEAVKRGDKAHFDNTLWWLNQTGYLGERFGIALIDDLLAARGLPPRQRPISGVTSP